MTGNIIKLTFAKITPYTYTPLLPLPSPKRGVGRTYYLASPPSAWVCLGLPNREAAWEGGTEGERERETKKERRTCRYKNKDKERYKET